MSKSKAPNTGRWDLILVDLVSTVRRTWLRTQKLTPPMHRHLLLNYSTPRRKELIDQYRTGINCWGTTSLYEHLQQELAPRVNLHFGDKIILGERKHRIADEWLTTPNLIKAGKPIKQYQDDVRRLFEEYALQDILFSTGLRGHTVEEIRLQSMLLDTEGRLGSLSLQCQALLRKLRGKE